MKRELQALAACADWHPGLLIAGLEVIDEQGPTNDMAALHEGMMQAFQQLGKSRVNKILVIRRVTAAVKHVVSTALSACLTCCDTLSHGHHTGVRGPSPMPGHLNGVSPHGSKPGTPSPLDVAAAAAAAAAASAPNPLLLQHGLGSGLECRPRKRIVYTAAGVGASRTWRLLSNPCTSASLIIP